MAVAKAAFLPDTFHEVNGVAHTSRQFEAFARKRQIPFLSIHCGAVEDKTVDGAVRIIQLKRGPARLWLDSNLDYDPFLMRYANSVVAEVRSFGADLIHITGPGDMGTLGLHVARRLGLPLVISWHTSLHEYASSRLKQWILFLGPKLAFRVAEAAEKLALNILRWFYRKAAIVLAPNEDLVQMTSALSGHPAFLMKRGVDTALFSPARRNRMDSRFQIGYVGRLTAEKNVRFLAELDRSLTILGRDNFEIVIVGEGREETWLRKHVPHALFTGVLRGEKLAEVYAGMDLFVFPSTTDTFGNVVLEALASGVPAVVRSCGGPKFVVQHGISGLVASNGWEMVMAVNELMTTPALHRSMGTAARKYACAQSWDRVFEQVLVNYEHCRPENRALAARAGAPQIKAV